MPLRSFGHEVGTKKRKRVVSGLQRVGQLKGHAKYHRDKGLKAMKNSESIAKVMEHKINQYESAGKYIRAQTMKTAASKTRNTGEKIKKRGEPIFCLT